MKKSKYDFNEYVNIDRWINYYYQIKYTMDNNIKNILIFGIGDGLIPTILSKLNKNVTTFDNDKLLNPDILGDIKNIKESIYKKYDCILCCNLLEHFPFEEFSIYLKNLSEITKKRLIISLPVNGYYVSSKTKILFYKFRKTLKFKFYIKKFWKKDFIKERDGFNEHFWEINASIYSKKKVRNIIKDYFLIEDEFIAEEDPYHIIYILKPKGAKV